ncbi:uncharacterized protein CTRU02_200314 [Colletotrichum truncatum]|uniref:Uncharacterized protein n=1 Tax=Colletotrichum truncatum TaxID=5467 RepID=A0ACC3ZET5_COLTU|nr:uncharacterized protein CTRU02_00068 [Colletotrichum truncatum]KAF6801318.1 hypothetical protein CTRU02_00068 [Colletotrichum truncatum]
MQNPAKATATNNEGNKKRKSPIMIQPEESKKGKPSPTGSPTTPLSPFHDALLTELRAKYDVLPAFTISSTKIQKRVSWVLQHLRKDDGDPRKRAVLLYARPSEVGKMITISEQVKRIVVEEEGRRWYQYNKMYELPPKAEVVEETMLGGAGGDEDSDEDDDFEVMESRFERAVLPQPAKRAALSLSIFLSLDSMPELKTKEGVTVQTNEPQVDSTIATAS